MYSTWRARAACSAAAASSTARSASGGSRSCLSLATAMRRTAGLARTARAASSTCIVREALRGYGRDAPRGRGSTFI